LLALAKFGLDESQEAVGGVNRTLRIDVEALKPVPNCPRNGICAAGYYALNVNDVYGKRTPSLPSGRLRGGAADQLRCPPLRDAGGRPAVVAELRGRG